MELQICEKAAHRSYSSKKAITRIYVGKWANFPRNQTGSPYIGTYKMLTQIIIIFILQVFFLIVRVKV